MAVYRMIWKQILSHDSADVVRICFAYRHIICNVHTRFPKMSTWLNRETEKKEETKQINKNNDKKKQTVCDLFETEALINRCRKEKKRQRYSLRWMFNVFLILSHHLTAVNAIFVWHQIDCYMFSWHEDSKLWFAAIINAVEYIDYG